MIPKKLSEVPHWVIISNLVFIRSSIVCPSIVLSSLFPKVLNLCFAIVYTISTRHTGNRSVTQLQNVNLKSVIQYGDKLYLVHWLFARLCRKLTKKKTTVLYFFFNLYVFRLQTGLQKIQKRIVARISGISFVFKYNLDFLMPWSDVWTLSHIHVGRWIKMINHATSYVIRNDVCSTGDWSAAHSSKFDVW
jgi:hypothetical protein